MWYEANAYCKWLAKHWEGLYESYANDETAPRQIRLPLEIEWVFAAGGDRPKMRYPWDKLGKETTDRDEIVKHTNVSESKIGHTTPVNKYPDGCSPFGVMDMAGNVWEWQANSLETEPGGLSLRGGSWKRDLGYAQVSNRGYCPIFNRNNSLGFRVIIIPHE